MQTTGSTSNSPSHTRSKSRRPTTRSRSPTTRWKVLQRTQTRQQMPRTRRPRGKRRRRRRKTRRQIRHWATGQIRWWCLPATTVKARRIETSFRTHVRHHRSPEFPCHSQHRGLELSAWHSDHRGTRTIGVPCLSAAVTFFCRRTLGHGVASLCSFLIVLRLHNIRPDHCP